ncbi:MAG: amidophosphoribosyltransferase, partial [Candidatus Cloacimonetes bacterium]|nr:amidophosphoribosyltransferase [Candidatus Cloacimonadota bacterium]
GVRQKYNVLPNFFDGKRVVLIDDSIVRGGTIGKIVSLIRDAGAKEIHLRIGSPQVRYSCFFGIDTPNRDELVANRMSVDEITSFFGADSLRHLDIPGIRTCVGHPDHYCYACFNGKYPVEN